MVIGEVIGVLLSRYRIARIFSRDHEFSHATVKCKLYKGWQPENVLLWRKGLPRVTELFDNLADCKFVTKAAVNAKGGEVYVLRQRPECIGKRGIIMCFVAEYLSNHARV